MSRAWFAAVLLLSLACPALAQAPLAWRFQEKETFRVEWSTTLDSYHRTARETAWNKLGDGTEKITAVLRFTVLKALPDGGAELELLVESVGGNPVKARVDPRVVLGHPVRAALDGRMNVTRLDGIEPICRKRFGEGAEPPQAGLFKAEVEEICRGWLHDIFIPLPGKAAAAGEKWEQETRRALAPLGQLVLRKTFTHEGKTTSAGRELTRIGVTATSTLVPARDGEFNLPYRILRAELEQAEYRGAVLLDAAGRPAQAELRLKTQVSAIFAARGEAEGLVARQEQLTTVRVLEKSPAAASAPAPEAGPADAPYRKLLTGQDAQLAASLEKRTAELTEAGLWGEALKLAREVAVLRARVQGAGHWQAADAARNVRTLEKLLSLSQVERAEFLAVPRMLEQAAQLRAAGKPAEGDALCDKAWEVRARILGKEHESMVGVYENLAAMQASRGEHADAQVLTETALEVAQRVLGEDHPDTARAYANLACSLSAQGKFAEAEPLLRKSVEIHARVLGEAHPQTIRACAQRGELLRRMGREQEGLELLRRAEALQRRAGGS
jgi:tetratricopeptide (TPR) repeat protein